jgi:phosphotriesterase-related protein
MDNGSPIGMDRFGMDIMADAEARIDTVFRLIELGYADRLTLSHDAGFFSANMEPSLRRKLMPNWHHRYISEGVLPELRRRGVAEETIEQIMVGNAARILAGRTTS